MKLIPLALCMVPCLAAMSASAVSMLKITGGYTEKVVAYRDPDSGTFYDTKQTGMASFTATVPLYGVDINSFDESTGFDFSVGYEGSAEPWSLGDDPNYKPGKKSATFLETDYDDIHDKEIVTGRVTVSWTSSTLTINATASFDAFGFRDLYGFGETAGTTKIYDAMPAYITLGDFSVSRTVYIKGQNTTTVQRVGSGEFADEYTLNSGSFTGEADFKEPTVTIVSPPANKSYKDPTNTIVVTINAMDNLAFGPGEFETPSIFLYWNNYYSFSEPITFSPLDRTNRITWSTDPLELIPGTNTLWVYALDESFNYSKLVSRSFFYSVPATLTLVTNGPGKITGLKSLNLEIGRGYKITAVPDKNKVLLNWTDGEGNLYGDSTSLTLNFIMTEGLELHANFGDNPFGPAAGNYVGLFSREYDEIDPDSGVNPHHTGYITVLIGPKGTYSGKGMIGGKTVPWSGQFLLDTNNNSAFCRTLITPIMDDGYHEGDVYAELNVDLGSGAVLGGYIIETDLFNSEFNRYALVFANRAHYTTNPPSGTFNFAVADSVRDSSIAPAGFSYGTVVISKTGAANVMLNLADGSPVASLSTFVAADGSFPFYASSRHGRGVFVGWGTFLSDNEMQGSDVNWVSWSDQPVGKIYPSGFYETEMPLYGTRFVAPKPGTNLVAWTSGSLVFGGGNVETPGYYETTFQNNKFLFAPSSKASAILTSTTGAVSGGFPPTVGARAIQYKGILLPSAGEFSGGAYGYFKGTNETGFVSIEEQGAP